MIYVFIQFGYLYGPIIVRITAEITTGYGIASGVSEDQRFSEGSIAMQTPHFKQLGLDLTGYFKGTLNVDIFPYRYIPKNPQYYFKDVCWSHHMPSETFFF